MIGQEIQSRPTGRVGAAFFFVVAAFLVLLAIVGRTSHLAVFAAFPFVLGIAVLVLVEPVVEFTVTEDGLTFTAPESTFVPYHDVQGLTAPRTGSRNDFAIQVYFSDGVVRIPANLNVSSWALYKFLLDQLPPIAAADPDAVPIGLRNHVAEQVELFGPEKVLVFRARPFPPLNSYRQHVCYARAVAVVGGVWLIGGVILESFASNGGAWCAAGVALLFIGILVAVGFSRASVSGRPGNWRESCLVISPVGIALLQGSLRGRMRWDELRAIEFPAHRRFGLSSHGATRGGIGLLVEGAYFIVADFYDRPLAQIHACLVTFWGGRDAN